jgi:hypothetical protein
MQKLHSPLTPRNRRQPLTQILIATLNHHFQINRTPIQLLSVFPEIKNSDLVLVAFRTTRDEDGPFVDLETCDGTPTKIKGVVQSAAAQAPYYI